MYSIENKSFDSIEDARLEAIEFVKKFQEMAIISFSFIDTLIEPLCLKNALLKIVNRNIKRIEESVA